MIILEQITENWPGNNGISISLKYIGDGFIGTYLDLYPQEIFFFLSLNH